MRAMITEKQLLYSAALMHIY